MAKMIEHRMIRDFIMFGRAYARMQCGGFRRLGSVGTGRGLFQLQAIHEGEILPLDESAVRAIHVVGKCFEYSHTPDQLRMFIELGGRLWKVGRDGLTEIKHGDTGDGHGIALREWLRDERARDLAQGTAAMFDRFIVGCMEVSHESR